MRRVSLHVPQGTVSLHGRGASYDPPNRFEAIHVEPDGEFLDSEPARDAPRTQYFVDPSRTIISENDSPDIGFRYSINPYRGCEHGCIYCYARPTHEYLTLSAGLDFETKIFCKVHAAALLRKELMSQSWRGEPICFSGVTDAYQPVERQLKITRACLEVLREFRNPFSFVTKGHCITRDIDIISDMAKLNATAAFISTATLDPKLAMILEPRAPAPARRLDAVRQLADAGVPVGVMSAPIIPGLNDCEIPAILEAASQAGARMAGYTMLRLPFAVAPLFLTWLEQHYPDRKEKVVHKIMDMRHGKLNHSTFGERMRAAGVLAGQIKSVFDLSKRRFGLDQSFPTLDSSHFRKPRSQMNLF